MTARNEVVRFLQFNLFTTLPLTSLLFVASADHTAEHFWEILLLAGVVINLNYVALALLYVFVWRPFFRGTIVAYVLLSVLVLPIVGLCTWSISYVLLHRFLATVWFGPFRDMAGFNVILVVLYGLTMYLLKDNRRTILTVQERLVDSEKRETGLEIQRYKLETERDELVLERNGMQMERDDSKLAVMQVMLKSHFIFNALNAIATLIRDDPEKAEQTTLGLARVLRTILEMRDRPLITLRTEIGILKEYVQIEQVRMGARLSFAVSAPEELLDILVPSMILQPLVENAIQHGVRQRRDGGAVHLRAFADGTMLHLEIVDNGPGISLHTGSGQAMALIRERLATLDPQSELTLERDPAKGETIVTVIVPTAPQRYA